jgi:hypothetical protein
VGDHGPQDLRDTVAVWTYGAFHAQDSSDPDNPKVIHGFFPKDSPGLSIVDTWDTLDRRATQSQDTSDTGLEVDSKAQAEQIRSVAVERVGARVGVVPPTLMNALDEALRLHLSL